MGELKMEIIGTKLHTHERPDQYRRKRMTDYVDLDEAIFQTTKDEAEELVEAMGGDDD